MLTADTITDAARELCSALDEAEVGMPVESDETAGAWFARSDSRIRRARARCAEILNTRSATEDT